MIDDSRARCVICARVSACRLLPLAYPFANQNNFAPLASFIAFENQKLRCGICWSKMACMLANLVLLICTRDAVVEDLVPYRNQTSIAEVCMFYFKVCLLTITLSTFLRLACLAGAKMRLSHRRIRTLAASSSGDAKLLFSVFGLADRMAN